MKRSSSDPSSRFTISFSPEILDLSQTPTTDNRRPTTDLRLLFSGYYGLGNAGDEAVLGGLLEGIRSVGISADVTVLSASPEETERWHGVKAVRRMKPDVLRAIAGCDVLISGGGSLLQDVTSVASLGYYLGIIGAAQAMGKRVVIAAQGMGPLNRPASRRWVGSVLDRCDLLTVRDEDSAALLRECGVRRKIHVTADSAFLLENPPVPSSAREGKKSPVIGLALRAWPDRDAAAWGAELCRELLEEGAIPLLIPMQEPQDRLLAESIAAATGAGAEIASPPAKLAEVLRSLHRCDALVGMRLHALILAANAGIPIVSWSYDPKVDALMNRIGGGLPRLTLSATPAQAAEAALSALQIALDYETIHDLREQAMRTLALLRWKVKGNPSPGPSPFRRGEPKE